MNLEQIISSAAQAAGDRPILAASFSLPKLLCRALCRQGIIDGYISDRRPEPAERDPFVAGWWLDRSAGVWFLAAELAHTVILLGGSETNEIGGRMLLEARLKGVKRILLIRPDGSIARDVDAGDALLRQLETVPIDYPIHNMSYDAAFEDLYALLGDTLRLPPAAFDAERVLIVTSHLGPGGAERQVNYTARGLGKRLPGKIVVVRSRGGGDLDFHKATFDAAGIPTDLVSEAECFSPAITEIRNQLAARYHALEFQYIVDLIFNHAHMLQRIRPGLVHTFLDYSNIFAGIAADLVGIPRLVLGGRSVAPDNFGIFQPHMEPGYRKLLKRGDVVFLNNSEAGANDYARWLGLPRSRFRVVHNGFEFPDAWSHWRAAQRGALKIPEQAIVVGSIIGFREEKRPQLFIDMARVVHERLPDVQFVLWGDGELLSACRAAVASLDLGDVVHLPGLTDNAWAALAAMDIFVLTSRIEGLPNVLIEAQGIGLPVVCSGAGGMSETFVDGVTGYKVQEPSGEALAAAVARLIVDAKLRAGMGEAALRNARAKFGVERMIDQTLDAYAQAAAAGRSTLPDEWRTIDAVN